MSRRRLIVFAVVVVVQLAVVLGWVASVERHLATGRPLVLAVEGRDPRDLLRGDYVTLAFPFERLEGLTVPDGLEEGDAAYVVFDTTAEPAEAVAMVAENPGLVPGRLALRVRVEGPQRVTAPNLTRFFVPEGAGRPLEDDIRDAAVTLVVAVDDDGAGVVRQLRVGGTVVADTRLFP